MTRPRVGLDACASAACDMPSRALTASHACCLASVDRPCEFDVSSESLASDASEQLSTWVRIETCVGSGMLAKEKSHVGGAGAETHPGPFLIYRVSNFYPNSQICTWRPEYMLSVRM